MYDDGRVDRWLAIHILFRSSRALSEFELGTSTNLSRNVSNVQKLYFCLTNVGIGIETRLLHALARPSLNDSHRHGTEVILNVEGVTTIIVGFEPKA